MYFFGGLLQLKSLMSCDHMTSNSVCSVCVGYVLRSPTGVRTRTSGAAFTCDDVRQEAEVRGLVRSERAIVIATAESRARSLQGNERGRLSHQEVSAPPFPPPLR